MPPVLPFSLSPHICIQASQDLSDLLDASELPPLSQILQSFSPLPQVTTRTTALTTVPHASFALRFSDLNDVEVACREDEEQRAARTLDWIGSRVRKRCARWVEDMEKPGASDELRTPWWDEVKRCVEGDHIPSRTEAWNHPVAIIYAVSTSVPNPLQAITALHSKPHSLPPWVDSSHIRCTLIVHPANSPLNDEEAGALFNAVKKQYGLHSYLLPLALPSPRPAPVPVPALPPRLPPPSPESDMEVPETPITAVPLAEGKTAAPVADGASSALNTLKMTEKDIQQTARFTREFVTMSLIPWMERCVVEWNDAYSSGRRLGSRLFSSTRRIFGTSGSATPQSPVHATPTRSHTYNTSQGSIVSVNGGTPASGSPSQQRRLAEFATVLGDFKLAVTVWESLRKDGKGGSEILPLLLTPAPTIPLHASHALSVIHPATSELPAHAQLRALIYAVRWEIGISPPDFLSHVMEGERWLVWAAGNAEEPPSALLLAHAALLSARKAARRRAALWYLFAANRLEKFGIKPLTMYFLRRAHDLYQVRPEKELSPSFWESEGVTPEDEKGFDDIIPGLEQPLGRLLYTTGDIASAVRLFLGLLREPTDVTLAPVVANGFPHSDDKVFNAAKVLLEDFRVAFTHYQANASGGEQQLSELKLPFQLSQPRVVKVRLPRDHSDGDVEHWQAREDAWRDFWRPRGNERMEQSGKAAVNEHFWVDLVLRNPLDTEVTLSNLTLQAHESGAPDQPLPQSVLEVESLDEVILGPGETRTIPIAIKSLRPISLVISHATFVFLSLLPVKESLASRGRRLQDTPQQRQTPTYAPDVVIKIDVEEVAEKLLINYVDDGQLVLAHGETKQMKLWVSNQGSKDIGELWVVAGDEDEIWVDDDDDASGGDQAAPSQVFQSSNSLARIQPHKVPLNKFASSSKLVPGEHIELPITLHASMVIHDDLRLLFVYREMEGNPFRSVRVPRSYQVQSEFEISVTSRPSHSQESLFSFDVEIENVSSETVSVSDVMSLSPSWTCTAPEDPTLDSLSPSQTSHLFFSAGRWNKGSGIVETLDFVASKLSDVLHGREVPSTAPPSIDVLCTHTSKIRSNRPAQEVATRHFIRSGRRNITMRQVSSCYPHIPSTQYPTIFPLYNPSSIDVVVFWEIPSQQRHGHLLVTGITLGARHARLREVIEEVESAKIKRSMYAETQREKSEVLEAIRNSEWNAEMNPILATVQDNGPVGHDFSTGPCPLSPLILLRNYSSTHPTRFVLRLMNLEGPSVSRNVCIPQYTGRLTFRGELAPLQSTTVKLKAWLAWPGIYDLSTWQVESDVGEPSCRPWRSRHRYVQGPTASTYITVFNVSHP